MLSFKQLEAIYWASQLGTFAATAEKLHASESAISKRITELEGVFGVPLFDRTLRSARLTRCGEEVVETARAILDLRNQLFDRMGKAELAIRRFRVGVTELVALTWLPRLVEAFQREYPGVSLEPEVDLSLVLCAKLSAGAIDFAIVPPVFHEATTRAVALNDLELVWVCRPGLVPAGRALSLAQLAQYPVLAQAGKSGVDAVYDQWFQKKRVVLRKIYAGNSLVSLASLTTSGIGVSYLPALYFRDLIERGQLQEIALKQAPPPVPYYGIFRANDEAAGFSERFAQICVRVCDFAKPAELAVAGRLRASQRGRPKP
ncbi:LysR family transcriptional regulator [Verminephrobacter aporrectodeae]|uniref:LysR family transcriptional regulator n=1 Tax=Verminephrobacter aporrectodeae TaxID=1110389 RepID=UPI0002375428|nr:LysR family transcriptional regulator [Verminephrobacter aporrectodeae]